jgi:hypothetical protein
LYACNTAAWLSTKAARSGFRKTRLYFSTAFQHKTTGRLQKIKLAVAKAARRCQSRSTLPKPLSVVAKDRSPLSKPLAVVKTARKTNGKVLYFHTPRAMICMVKAQFGAGMAPSDLLVASSQAGPTLVAQQS